MHDIVIRGGTIVDGTGRPAFVGDVAIDGDKIVSVGGKAGPARRDIDAAGHLLLRDKRGKLQNITAGDVFFKEMA